MPASGAKTRPFVYKIRIDLPFSTETYPPELPPPLTRTEVEDQLETAKKEIKYWEDKKKELEKRLKEWPPMS